MIVAVPDCMTALGGSQYVDSAAVGRYETFVVREVVPFVDARHRTLADARHRGVCGKSSGGYGALMLAMKHPDVFGALASHSGDAYFEYCYGYDFVKCWNGVRNAGGVNEWLAAFRKKPRKGHDDVLVLNILAMAACYSPNRRSPWGFDLPFDVETCEPLPRVMARWKRFDPVESCRAYAANLRKLRGIYLDCGLRDEFSLHAGTRILAKRLRALGLKVVHEEFDDGHMGIGYRYDRSFAWLGKWL
jgi:enterochelin esterase family protein